MKGDLKTNIRLYTHKRAPPHTHIHRESLKTSVKKGTKSIINSYLTSINIRNVDVMMSPIFQKCFFAKINCTVVMLIVT